MKTDTLLHRLKPDGHKDAAIVTSMRHLINEMQELADAAHTEIAAIHQPTDLIATGWMEPWPEHEPLQLEIYPTLGGRFNLHGIRVRGAHVGNWISSQLWSDAEQWIREHLDDNTTNKTVDRMDRADEIAERKA